MEFLHFEELLIAFVVLVPLELLFPIHADKAMARPGWKLDLTYAILNGVLVRAGILLILIATAQAAGSLIPGVRAWVGSFSLWLQIPVALLISDLGWYWAHRAAHHFPWLWRFHAVHHSIENMDWLAGYRVHPLDQVVTRSAALVPVLLLGFSEAALIPIMTLFYWQGLLEHSNIRLRGGPLEHIFVFPQYHHWHHADHPDAWDRNFAGQLSLLDWVFGTRYSADGPPEGYGSSTPVPDGYVDQLLFPFKPEPEPVVLSEEAG